MQGVNSPSLYVQGGIELPMLPLIDLYNYLSFVFKNAQNRGFENALKLMNTLLPITSLNDIELSDLDGFFGFDAYKKSLDYKPASLLLRVYNQNQCRAKVNLKISTCLLSMALRCQQSL